ncbi:hypothetical protein [Jiella marina]|uniref:hypothetical protein n=1 Tax=Jiella sp. LLJ827 TaxID=2917712 RepID=UPI0021017DC8|nr:hypothetical protein [Jiella sp. LLJ827]MCQ0987230.1 hypothetical protein [Jiella sp. LLJ827]
MKIVRFKIVILAIAALFGTAGIAQAGCDFFEHNDLGGAALALQDGECAVLSGDSSAGCEGLNVRVVDGWNDKISSVRLNHNSTAILKQHDNGSGAAKTVQGNRGVASLPDFNDEASVVLCRQ